MRNAKGTLLGHTIGQVGIEGVPSWNFIHQRSLIKHPDYNIGDYVDLPNGKRFRYGRSGGAVGGLARAAINGNVIPGDTNGSGYEGSLVSAVAAGKNIVVLTDTASAANRPVDYYAGGTFVAFIATHYLSFGITKSTVGNGTSITITLDAALTADCSASVGVTAYPSIYGKIMAASAVLQNVETFIGVPACPNVAATLTYFWVQTRGPLWITAHGGTWPGASTALRDVYFHIDGTIDPATIMDVGTLAPQRAGYLLHSGSTGSYGDGVIMLQLE